MTQLTLDGRDMRVKVYVQTAYGPDWFAAKCAACGVPLTKYDFTWQDAHDLAVSELETHRCRP